MNHNLIIKNYIQIDATPEKVWDVLTDPKYIRQWDELPEDFGDEAVNAATEIDFPGYSRMKVSAFESGKVIRYAMHISDFTLQAIPDAVYSYQISVDENGKTWLRIEIGDFAVADCQNLRELVLNVGLQKIGEFAFWKCTSLECISLPSSITEVGDFAFDNCENLREVILHEGMGKIGRNAFYNCVSLEVFRVPLLSRRLVLLAVNWRELNNKVNELCGVVEWGNDRELFVPATAMEHGNNWENIRDILSKIERTVSCYEMKEATTIYELALWKSKLDDAGNITANRSDHRVTVPGPAQNTILEYLLGKRKSRSVN